MSFEDALDSPLCKIAINQLMYWIKVEIKIKNKAITIKNKQEQDTLILAHAKHRDEMSIVFLKYYRINWNYGCFHEYIAYAREQLSIVFWL